MFVTVFIIAQLAFNLAVLVGLLASRSRKRAQRTWPPEPEWCKEFAALAQDLVETIDPILDALEARSASTGPPSASERYTRATLRLQQGQAPDFVAGAERLLPCEVRLLEKLNVTQSR